MKAAWKSSARGSFWKSDLDYDLTKHYTKGAEPETFDAFVCTVKLTDEF